MQGNGAVRFVWQAGQTRTVVLLGGAILPVGMRRVMATVTTATGIHGLALVWAMSGCGLPRAPGEAAAARLSCSGCGLWAWHDPSDPDESSAPASVAQSTRSRVSGKGQTTLRAGAGHQGGGTFPRFFCEASSTR